MIAATPMLHRVSGETTLAGQFTHGFSGIGNFKPEYACFAAREINGNVAAETWLPE